MPRTALHFPGTERIPAGPIEIRVYGNLRPALAVGDTKLTVNLPNDHDYESWNEIALKNWNENVGVVDAMVAAHLVRPPHRFVRSGFVEIPVCLMTRELTAAFE